MSIINDNALDHIEECVLTRLKSFQNNFPYTKEIAGRIYELEEMIELIKRTRELF